MLTRTSYRYKLPQLLLCWQYCPSLSFFGLRCTQGYLSLKTSMRFFYKNRLMLQPRFVVATTSIFTSQTFIHHQCLVVFFRFFLIFFLRWIVISNTTLPSTHLLPTLSSSATRLVSIKGYFVHKKKSNDLIFQSGFESFLIEIVFLPTRVTAKTCGRPVYPLSQYTALSILYQSIFDPTAAQSPPEKWHSSANGSKFGQFVSQSPPLVYCFLMASFQLMMGAIRRFICSSPQIRIRIAKTKNPTSFLFCLEVFPSPLQVDCYFVGVGFFMNE